MLGQPKFKREDRVSFRFPIEGEEKVLDGVVYKVDNNAENLKMILKISHFVRAII